MNGNTKECNNDNKHFLDSSNIHYCRGNTNERSETDKRSYECLYPGCAVIAKSYKEYITHRKTHGQPFIYECKVPGCGRTFHHDSSFRSHKQTHEPKPQCEGCGKFFATRITLQHHKKICKTKSR
uniref:Zinc finger, C2H2 type family protein n=1 Tax=Brugia malayi TaxID=6279 RepID=A8PV29_BRUMA